MRRKSVPLVPQELQVLELDQNFQEPIKSEYLLIEFEWNLLQIFVTTYEECENHKCKNPTIIHICQLISYTI